MTNTNLTPFNQPQGKTNKLTALLLDLFEGHNVSWLTDHKGEVWFLAKDICKILEITNTSQVLSRIDEDEKLIDVLHISGQDRRVWLINESGLFSFLDSSNKPKAKELKRFIRKEILTQVRKTGSYNPEPQIDISKITVFDMARHLLTAEQDIKAKEAVIQKQETQIFKLTTKNENLQDKARTAELLTGTEGLIGLSALAGSLDIPIYKLKGMLIAHGWLYQRGERLYVHHRHRKNIRLKFDSKNGKITTRPQFTGAGLVYVMDRLLKSGLITKKQADEAKNLKIKA